MLNLSFSAELVNLSCTKFIIPDWAFVFGWIVILGLYLAFWDEIVAEFVIGKLHSELNLSIWAEFLILAWIGHSECVCHFWLTLPFFGGFVIIGIFCHSLLNFYFWAEFVIVCWIYPFWNQSVVLSSICYSWQNLSFWAEFLIPGWVFCSEMNL